MLQVGLGFSQADNTVVLGIGTVPQALYLREYVPDPVITLFSHLHFFEGDFIAEPLAIEETLKIIHISWWSCFECFKFNDFFSLEKDKSI